MCPPGTGSRTILITGGAGFIGSHLADRLVEEGADVRIIDDLSTGRLSNIRHLLDHPRVRFVEGDVRDRDALDGLLDRCDEVYHLAAVVGVHNVLEDPLSVIDENIPGTRVVLEGARQAGAAVFLASTSEIYGKNDNVPFREDSDRVLGPPQVDRWSYATSKAVDEVVTLAHARKHGMRVVVGRFFNVVGRRQTGKYGMVVPRFVEQALAGEPLTVYGDGEQTRTFCDVRDAVRAMTRLMADPDAAGRPYNIGSRREIPIGGLARLVLEQLAPERAGEEGSIRHVPYEDAYPDGYEEFPRRVPDIDRIRKQIDWLPSYSLAQTLHWIARGSGNGAPASHDSHGR